MQSKINNFISYNKKIMDKTNVKCFREYYMALPKQERAALRDKFLEVSGISYPAWYGKLNGSPFTKLELAALSEITGIEIVS